MSDEKYTNIIGLIWKDDVVIDDVAGELNALAKRVEELEAKAAWKHFQSMLDPSDPAAAQPAVSREAFETIWQLGCAAGLNAPARDWEDDYSLFTADKGSNTNDR